MKKLTFPVLMVKGNAWVPQRFWEYVTVFDETQYIALLEQGFNPRKYEDYSM